MTVPTIVRFKSFRPRKPHPSLKETDASVRVNNEFDIKFHLTPRVEQGLKEEHVVVMVNGFAEPSDALYTDGPFGLPRLLRERGIASVHLPIPFHFNRLQRTPYYERIAKQMSPSVAAALKEIWDKTREPIAAFLDGPRGPDMKEAWNNIHAHIADLLNNPQGPALEEAWNKINRPISRFLKGSGGAALDEAWNKVREHIAELLRRAGNTAWDESGHKIPAFIVWTQKERFYLGYRQLISDLRYLASAIQDSDNERHPAHCPLYRQWFSKSTQVHLLGYSIGGLGCLAALLKSRMQEAELQNLHHEPAYHEPKFGRCILLCSGATFIDLDPSSLGFPPKKWDALREYYYQRQFDEELRKRRKELAKARRKEREALLKADEEALKEIRTEIADMRADKEALRQIRTRRSVSYRIFERVILGVPWTNKELESASPSILAILGARDAVVPPESLLSIRPKERRFCTIAIPELTHEILGLADRKAWSEWSAYIASSIVSFIKGDGVA